MSLDDPQGLTADRQNPRRRDVRRLNIVTPAMPAESPTESRTEPPADLPTEPSSAHLKPDTAPPMRLEILEVDEVKFSSLPSLAGSWAWLLFHGDGSLIAYSDGYAMRSNCVAAAKRIGWPIDISE